MADSIAKSCVILLHGPPFAGKNRVINDLLSGTHTHICPEDLFEQNPSFGLRDVAIQVLKSLKKKAKVVIDSDSCTVSARRSYISLIKKMLPHIQISIVEILPKYGCEQLFWAREHDLAWKSWDGQEIKESRLRVGRIEKWFASEDDIDVTYKKGIVEPPKENEGAKVHRMKLNLSCETIYKFEVPGLFIQWEILQTLTKDGKLSVGDITKVLNLWSSVCPCGRIIVINDGIALKSGMKRSSQACDEIVSIMKQLTQSFVGMLLYVFAVSSPKIAGEYAVPPRPGMIAFLQRRHNLDLHSKQTLYLHDTQQHMRMAERAGVAHVKGSRVLKHPTLVTSNHAAVIPSIPEMLGTMEIKQQSSDDQSEAEIPLAGKVEDFKEGFLKQDLPFGRIEYLFAEDRTVIERYQSLYSSKASKVSEPGSKIADEIKDQSDMNQQMTSQSNTSANISRTTSESRDLPKWMLPRDESGSSVKSSHDYSRSDSTSSADVKIKQTVYVMTEKELTEVAMDILRQAGKTDIVEQFQTKQQLEQSKKESMSTPHSNKKTTKTTKLTRPSVKKKKKQCNVEKSVDTDTPVIVPKLEIDEILQRTPSESGDEMFKVDSDSWHSEDESAHRHHINLDGRRTDNNDSESEAHGDTNFGVSSEERNKLDNKPYHVEGVVNNVLDELMESPCKVRRKTRLKGESPVKRPQRTDNEGETSGSPSKRLKSSKQVLGADITEGTNECVQNRNEGISDSSDTKYFRHEKDAADRSRKDSIQYREKHKRKTPDLAVLDDIFG